MPVFLGFPCDSAGKESTRNAGDLGLIPLLWRRERLPTPVFWPGEFHGLYSPWGCKELDTTEQLSLHFLRYQDCLCVGVVKIFLMFLEISVLVHHLQFFDEPTTATTFPV